MIYFSLGFSVSMNIFLISLMIFIFKKDNINKHLYEKDLDNNLKSKIYKKVDEIRQVNDPWINSL